MGRKGTSAARIVDGGGCRAEGNVMWVRRAEEKAEMRCVYETGPAGMKP